MCSYDHKNSSVLDLVPKYHTLEPILSRIAQLAEHWTSIPKVTVRFPPWSCKQTFQPVLCIYTQSNITNIGITYFL